MTGVVKRERSMSEEARLSFDSCVFAVKQASAEKDITDPVVQAEAGLLSLSA